MQINLNNSVFEVTINESTFLYKFLPKRNVHSLQNYTLLLSRNDSKNNKFQRLGNESKPPATSPPPLRRPIATNHPLVKLSRNLKL